MSDSTDKQGGSEPLQGGKDSSATINISTPMDVSAPVVAQTAVEVSWIDTPNSPQMTRLCALLMGAPAANDDQADAVSVLKEQQRQLSYDDLALQEAAASYRSAFQSAETTRGKVRQGMVKVIDAEPEADEPAKQEEGDVQEQSSA